jgi:hypothetical protein
MTTSFAHSHAGREFIGTQPLCVKKTPGSHTDSVEMAAVIIRLFLRVCSESNCRAIQNKADAIPVTSRTEYIPNGAGYFIAFLALLMTPFATYGRKAANDCQILIAVIHNSWQ